MHEGVEATVFIPLMVRIAISKKFPELFYDQKALSLEKYISDDIIKNNSSEYSFMASVARCYMMDIKIKEFINKHKFCNVVFLGAGLETAYYRLNGSTMENVSFYEIDLPDVITFRESLLGNSVNDYLIKADIFDLTWVKKLDSSIPTLLIAAGIFQYFNKEKIINFISEIKTLLVDLELIFDVTNRKGLDYANKYVKNLAISQLP